MAHHGQRRRDHTGVLLMLAGLLLSAAQSANVRAASLQPVITNNPLLAESRPWCIGRLVMDRPARSELYYEGYEYTGDKIDIASNVSQGTFQYKITTRENELKAQKRTILLPIRESIARGLPNGVVEIDTPWLEQAVSPSNTSRLLIYKEDGGRPDGSYDGEGYVLAGSNMFSMKFDLGSDAVQQVIHDESEWYRNVSYRDDWTVPTERGFCISGGLIGGASRNSEAVEQTIILLPGRMSLLVINMREAFDVDQQSSLLKTLPDLRKDLRDQGYSHNVHILREGKRQVAGMDAEEVLLSIKEGKLQLYRFYLLAAGNPDSTAQPHTDIQLMLGDALHDSDQSNGMTAEQASSPVDEAGAIQAWDTLLNSMRLRPGAM